jgi:ubiquinone biosynthesis protein UbiJ
LFSASLIEPVEKLLNRGIDQSSHAAALCSDLIGRSMVVCVDTQLLKVPLTARVAIDDGRLEISGDIDGRADVELSGTLIELSRLMFTDSDIPLRDGHVRIHGDAEIAEKFRTLLLMARPDLEAELSELVGDELGPRIVSTFRKFRRFAIDSAEDISEHVADYLQEDAKQLPTRLEADTFFDAVDELSNDLARIEARLSKVRVTLEESDLLKQRRP